MFRFMFFGRNYGFECSDSRFLVEIGDLKDWNVDLEPFRAERGGFRPTRMSLFVYNASGQRVAECFSQITIRLSKLSSTRA